MNRLLFESIELEWFKIDFLLVLQKLLFEVNHYIDLRAFMRAKIIIHNSEVYLINRFGEYEYFGSLN